ncbi:hypothetical protein MAR_009576 [Mya arenaria]|uniref:Uncharacterized protein n=1 Tax=Mya arenaria TaxID=6604 RepID=A0ABY7DZ71_MYAAR|nr:hypothetical protein MAR_009576 [Mya arenaria]
MIHMIVVAVDCGVNCEDKAVRNMTTMEPNPPYLPDSNYTQDFYLYNESYYNESFDYEHYLHARRQAAIFDTMDFERRRFVN